MKLIELRDKLNEMLDDDCGNYKVYFDTDAMSFDQHWVEVDSCNVVDEGLIEDSGFVILNFDHDQTLYHYNTDIYLGKKGRE